jgi:hypothetical protein
MSYDGTLRSSEEYLTGFQSARPRMEYPRWISLPSILFKAQMSKFYKRIYEQKINNDFEVGNETKSKEQISHEGRPYSRKMPRRNNMA